MSLSTDFTLEVRTEHMYLVGELGTCKHLVKTSSVMLRHFQKINYGKVFDGKSSHKLNFTTFNDHANIPLILQGFINK